MPRSRKRRRAKQTLLAEQQTILSKERTILSFMQTGLGFIGAGIIIAKLTEFFVIGWVLIAVGFFEIVLSAHRLYLEQRFMDRLKR